MLYISKSSVKIKPFDRTYSHGHTMCWSKKLEKTNFFGKKLSELPFWILLFKRRYPFSFYEWRRTWSVFDPGPMSSIPRENWMPISVKVNVQCVLWWERLFPISHGARHRFSLNLTCVCRSSFYRRDAFTIPPYICIFQQKIVGICKYRGGSKCILPVRK